MIRFMINKSQFNTLMTNENVNFESMNAAISNFNRLLKIYNVWFELRWITNNYHQLHINYPFEKENTLTSDPQRWLIEWLFEKEK